MKPSTVAMEGAGCSSSSSSSSSEAAAGIPRSSPPRAGALLLPGHGVTAGTVLPSPGTTGEGSHTAPDCSSPSSCVCEGAGGSGDAPGISTTSPESSASSAAERGVLAPPDLCPVLVPPGSRLSVEVAEAALVGDVTRCPGAPGLPGWAGRPKASRGRSGLCVGTTGLGGRGKPSGGSVSPAGAPVGPSGSVGWLGSRPRPGLSADALPEPLPGAAPCSSSAKGKAERR